MIATAPTAARRKPRVAAAPAWPDTIRAPLALVRAILERGYAAPGRLWFLLQVADAGGRGVACMARAEALASGPGDVAAGAGLFWDLDQGGARLRLRSPVRVGQWLGVSPRLARRRAALPVAELMAGPDRAAAAMVAAVEAALSPAERAARLRRLDLSEVTDRS